MVSQLCTSDFRLVLMMLNLAEKETEDERYVVTVWRSLPPVCSRIFELTLSKLRRRPTRYSQYNHSNTMRSITGTLQQLRGPQALFPVMRKALDTCDLD